MKTKYSAQRTYFPPLAGRHAISAVTLGFCLVLGGITSSAEGTEIESQFSFPSGLAVDTASNIYVADTMNHRICCITPAGTMTVLAGSTGVSGSANGIGHAALFNHPEGLALDLAGNIYVADVYNDTIRRVTPSGVVTTLAGLAGIPGNADGMGKAARFNNPRGVAVDRAGNVYVADRGNQTIRRITPAGSVSTLAGCPGCAGQADGLASAARFCCPQGVTVDRADNIYVADRSNHMLRKVTPQGLVTTIAGISDSLGYGDGTGAGARFKFPTGVATDGDGNIFVADPCNDEVRKVTAAGVVTTLAGQAGASGHRDEIGREARFSFPTSVAVDLTGNVYVTDTLNNAVRRITPAGLVTTLAGRVPAGD